jgi:gluconokinase
MIAVLMGVSGAGKTTVGRLLAEKLVWTFLDADDFHPAANIEKMSRGIPLDDSDRWPWLDRLNALLRQAQARGDNALLACSALKETYRRRLASACTDTRWVYLKGDFTLIDARLRARTGHYMKAGLLQSQFSALEEPANAIVADIGGTPEQIAQFIASRLKERPLPD